MGLLGDFSKGFVIMTVVFLDFPYNRVCLYETNRTCNTISHWSHNSSLHDSL